MAHLIPFLKDSFCKTALHFTPMLPPYLPEFNRQSVKRSGMSVSVFAGALAHFWNVELLYDQKLYSWLFGRMRAGGSIGEKKGDAGSSRQRSQHALDR
jgi:hypothetical protein